MSLYSRGSGGTVTMCSAQRHCHGEGRVACRGEVQTLDGDREDLLSDNGYNLRGRQDLSLVCHTHPFLTTNFMRDGEDFEMVQAHSQ